MKKVFFAICSLIPGGFLLFGTMLLFVGCSHYQVRSAGFQAEGRTSRPGEVAVSLAVAEDIRAEARIKNVCASNPEKCRAMELQTYGAYGMYGPGYMDTPEGYTWAGIQAVRGMSQQTRPVGNAHARSTPAVKATTKPAKSEEKPVEAPKPPQKATTTSAPQPKPQRVEIPQWAE